MPAAPSEIKSMPDPTAPSNLPIQVRWNDTRTPCDTDRCVHWPFEDQASRLPGAIAVDDGQTLVAYSQLNQRANQIAHYLRRSGIGRASLVGVLMHRSADLVAALLGILKSGAAYVPFEPSWPDDRIQWIAKALNLNAMVIDADQRFRSKERGGLEQVCVQDGRIGRLCTDRPGKAAALVHWCTELPTHNPTRVSAPDDRAYVIFTSGSTGDPKGVAVRHRPVINLIDWVNKKFKIGNADRILFSTSVAFDLSVYDIFGMLAAGATIRIATAAELDDPQRLAQMLCFGGITFWDSAPAALERLCPFLSAAKPVGTVRHIFLSGDWIPLGLPARIRSVLPNARIIALGGATEATVWSNFHEIDHIDPTWKSIPYGRPIQNVRYYILDANLHPCGVGISGDLYIGGACLADGYLNDPDLTARKFIPDPFVDGELIYHTGDRARYFPDGTIEFLGRADRQVKIRGFRVEPAEIETALERHPQVRRAAVTTQSGSGEVKRLGAHVVLHDPAVSDTIVSELRSFLRRTLPRYMVPADIICRPDLPMTRNGKVDLKALQSDPPHDRRSLMKIDLPSCEVQIKLAAIWCRVLRRKWIGIHDNFFDIGGDSLQSVEMIAAAAGVGLHLQLRDLHEHPTIAKLCDRCRTDGAGPEMCKVKEEIPLTPTQNWFFGRSLRHPGRYNAVFAFDVVGALDARTLSEAVTHLHSHHDAFRLGFERIDGRWLQFQTPDAPRPEVMEWDFSFLPDDLRRRAVQDRVAMLRQSLNLESGPLAKAVLLRRRPGQRLRLLLVLHHLIFDAASLCVLVEDLTTAIDQMENHLQICLPNGGSFTRWARYLANIATSEATLSEEGYWLSLPWKHVVPLPRDYQSTNSRYGAARVLRAELCEQKTRVLRKELPRLYNASTGEILLATCLFTLSQWAAQSTLLVELTDHGRQDPDGKLSIARMMGYVTINVPIVITLPPNLSIGEAVKLLRDHLRQMPRCGAGYGMLRSRAQAMHAGDQYMRHPGAELKFNYVGTMTGEGASSKRFRPIDMSFPGTIDPDDRRSYLHNLECSIRRGRLRIEWKYSSEVHRQRTIQLLLENFMAALRVLMHPRAAECMSSSAVGGYR
jgi:amino acid adenylation domain-containing protein/non-ribosomal peptide synthase protein (TIGR01720 family)